MQNNDSNSNDSGQNPVHIQGFLNKTNSLNFVMNGRPYSIPSSHPNFTRIQQCFRSQNYNDLPDLVDIPKSIQKSSNGRVTVKGNEVLYDGESIHHIVAERIVSHLSAQLPISPLLNFLEKLMENPSKRSVDQLYSFIEKHGLTITESGNVLMYKAITSDFKDKHTRKVDNSIGKVVQVPRNKVSDDPRSACSFGLHAGAESYVFRFGHGGDRFVAVEINPRDVVSVPFDSNETKVRVCEYKVAFELKRDDRFKSSLYSNEYTEVTSSNGRSCCDDEYGDEYEEAEELIDDPYEEEFEEDEEWDKGYY
jgi:hypothetical protein